MPPMALPSGTRLGPYVLDSLIGAGGMGEVYRAHDARLNRTVAIKVLSSRIASPDRVERFTQEARAASALNHPNILTIHDVGRENDIAYFAMEWVDGRTLRELLLAAPIPMRHSIDLGHQIARPGTCRRSRRAAGRGVDAAWRSVSRARMAWTGVRRWLPRLRFARA
jgi:serine/threonine protein kinase